MDRESGRRFRVEAILLIFYAGLISSGCGPAVKAPDASKQAQISGKVTLDGSKPVPLDSTIVFFNTEKSATVSGKVDALGNYTVKPADKSAGIPAGRFQVMVRPPDPPAVSMGSSDDYKKMMTTTTTKKEPVKSDIPAKFHAFDTSKIILEINPGPNKIELDLSKL
ncbi:MAG: hypothetical protein WCH39_06700 [Schlesneria sp.]